MIYFVLSDYQNAVKIGYVSDKSKLQNSLAAVRSRVGGIQTGNPQLLTVIGLIDGNYNEEQILHKQFKDIRLLGEWFTYTEELKEFISEKANKTYLKTYKSYKPRKDRQIRQERIDECEQFIEDYEKLKARKPPNTKLIATLLESAKTDSYLVVEGDIIKLSKTAMRFKGVK